MFDDARASDSRAGDEDSEDPDIAIARQCARELLREHMGIP
jgi:hypothetical protein